MVLLPPHNLGGIRGTFYSVNFNWLRPLIVTWLEPLELLGDSKIELITTLHSLNLNYSLADSLGEFKP